MRHLVFAVLAVICGVAGGCSDMDDPLSAKNHPGYTPPGSSLRLTAMERGRIGHSDWGHSDWRE